MTQLSISTMWSQGRFERAEDFIHTVSRLGYPAVEINHVVGPAFVDGLLANNVTVSSVIPLPRAYNSLTAAGPINSTSPP